MWDKDQDVARSREEFPARAPSSAEPFAANQQTVLGPSVVVKGKLSADEDFRLEGTVEGSIVLESNVLTVGGQGRVEGEVEAREVHVEGELQGDAVAGERIVVSVSGKVSGDLAAPRVVLEDGCSFSGQIDTESPVAEAAVKATA